MDLCLNELSIKVADSEKEVIQWFNSLLKIFKSFKILNPSFKIFSSYDNFNNILFGNKISFSSILNKIDQNDRSLILSKFINEPIIRDLPDYYVKNWINGLKSIGLGFAYENNHIGFSFQSNIFWNNHIIELIEVFPNEGIDDISERFVNVKHIYTEIHIENLEKSILSFLDSKKKLSEIFNIKKFWEVKENIFKNLIFANSVYVNLSKFVIDNRNFQDILYKLNLINEYFSQNKRLNYEGLCNYVTGRPRVDDKKDDLIFNFDNNMMLHCLHHIDFHLGKTFGTSSGRLHFHPDFQNKKCYIGYIGKHL